MDKFQLDDGEPRFSLTSRPLIKCPKAQRSRATPALSGKSRIPPVSVLPCSWSRQRFRGNYLIYFRLPFLSRTSSAVAVRPEDPIFPRQNLARARGPPSGLAALPVAHNTSPIRGDAQMNGLAETLFAFGPWA